jgi:hypothetical protein
MITDRQVVQAGLNHGVEAWPLDTVTRVAFGGGIRKRQIEVEVVKDPSRPDKRHTARIAGNPNDAVSLAQVALASALIDGDPGVIDEARADLDQTTAADRQLSAVTAATSIVQSSLAALRKAPVELAPVFPEEELVVATEGWTIPS